jgi:hypothetical protein
MQALCFALPHTSASPLQRFTIRLERPDDVVSRTGGTAPSPPLTKKPHFSINHDVIGTAKVLREKLVCADPNGLECQLLEEILVSVKALEASGQPNITRFLQVATQR